MGRIEDGQKEGLGVPASPSGAREPSQSSLSRPYRASPPNAFTPGPWFINVGELGVSAYLPGKSAEDEATEQSYYVPLAKVEYEDWQGDDWLISKAEYQANANLIAASPTMAEYIQRKADEGDEEAARIMELVHARR